MADIKRKRLTIRGEAGRRTEKGLGANLHVNVAASYSPRDGGHVQVCLNNLKPGPGEKDSFEIELTAEEAAMLHRELSGRIDWINNRGATP